VPHGGWSGVAAAGPGRGGAKRPRFSNDIRKKTAFREKIGSLSLLSGNNPARMAILHPNRLLWFDAGPSGEGKRLSTACITAPKRADHERSTHGEESKNN